MILSTPNHSIFYIFITNHVFAVGGARNLQLGPSHMYGTAVARVIMSCIQVAHIKYLFWDEWLELCDHFLMLGSNYIFGMGEARHFKLAYWLTLRSTSAGVINYPRTEIIPDHVTYLNLGEITNVLETVQDRDSCNGRPVGNSMRPMTHNFI